MNTDKTNKSLERLRDLRQETLNQSMMVVKAGDGNLYPLDLVVFGIAKRCLSTTSAIDNMVMNKNLTCARAILRIHLDTVLRLSAFWLPGDPQSMAIEVLKGKPIKDMKDRKNKRMHDSYLVKRLSEEYKWVPEVYKQTCAYIHFSEQHIFSAVSVKDNGALEISISELDEKHPEFSWLEVTDCASECLEIVNFYLRGYATTKSDTASKTV